MRVFGTSVSCRGDPCLHPCQGLALCTLAMWEHNLGGGFSWPASWRAPIAVHDVVGESIYVPDSLLVPWFGLKSKCTVEQSNSQITMLLFGSPVLESNSALTCIDR